MNWDAIVEKARILVVDDEQSNVRLLERMLSTAGYRGVTGTTEGSRAVELFDEISPDLVLLDLRMPETDGYQILEEIRRRVPPRTYLPILVMTADLSSEAKFRALLLGAKDFLTKPVDRLEAMLRIRILLETRFLFRDLTADAGTSDSDSPVSA